ncbi:MAG: hypothetical protein ABJA37_05720 [Ferruginibacter sp.]
MKNFAIIVVIFSLPAINASGQLGASLKQKMGEGVKQVTQKATTQAGDKTLAKLFGKKEKEDAAQEETNKTPDAGKNLSTITLPTTINFERTVIQQTNTDEGIVTTTYYFTLNGDYAMAKSEAPGEDKIETVLYTKEAQMCMINEQEKTITIMNMPKIMGDAGAAIKKGMDKKPIPKDKDDDKMTVTKTGKTKMICGYIAYEYKITTESGSSSWWYAQVDFDPVKIYTMGVGNRSMTDKIKNNPAMENNPMAIPVINKNYLWAEVDVAGKKGLETKSISKETYTFSTAGYTIKEMKGFKNMDGN